LAQTFGYGTANISQALASENQTNVPRPDDLSLDYEKLEILLGKPVPAVADGLARLRSLEEAGWPEKLRNAVGGANTRHRPLPA
jgi:dTDP-4-dehydrorhamnose reductase